MKESKKTQKQRITEIKHFIEIYNWKGINYPSEKITGKNWEKK